MAATRTVVRDHHLRNWWPGAQGTVQPTPQPQKMAGNSGRNRSITRHAAISGNQNGAYCQMDASAAVATTALTVIRYESHFKRIACLSPHR